jgi:large conductance mechanosensitive channel
MSGFKSFLLRGSLVDMAVGIVIGIAFSNVVQGFVKDLVTPLIAAIVGKPDFSQLVFTVNHSQFRYGDFFNALISFVLIAAVLYFLIVSPYARLKAVFEKPPAPEPETRPCPYCLTRIPVAARRCAFCTSDLVETARSES